MQPAQRLTLGALSIDCLSRFGGLRVTGIEILRTPIAAAIDQLLDVLTMKTWSEAKMAAGYDQFFHLFLFLHLVDGRVISLEKNSSIIIRENYRSQAEAGSDRIDVPIPFKVNKGQPLTLHTMLSRAQDRFGPERLQVYTAFDNNCQRFVDDLLTASGLNSKTIHSFVYQDVESVCKQLPSFIEGAANLLTDLAAKVGKGADTAVKWAAGFGINLPDLHLVRGGSLLPPSLGRGRGPLVHPNRGGRAPGWISQNKSRRARTNLVLV